MTNTILITATAAEFTAAVGETPADWGLADDDTVTVLDDGTVNACSARTSETYYDLAAGNAAATAKVLQAFTAE